MVWIDPLILLFHFSFLVFFPIFSILASSRNTNFILCIDFASSVQVSFDKPDSGFFFKHSSVQPQQQLLNNPISDLKNSPSSKENKDSVLSFNRFTVAQANHPVSIRASYGPFSTKQTVPARYIVPEDSENLGYQTKVGILIFFRTLMLLLISFISIFIFFSFFSSLSLSFY